jgi:hypothetical protein
MRSVGRGVRDLIAIRWMRREAGPKSIVSRFEA